MVWNTVSRRETAVASARLWYGLAVLSLAAALPAVADAYSVRVRWRPATDATVTGYKIRVRPVAQTTATVTNAGKPTVAADGTMTYTVSGLVVRTDYAFTVTAYRATGVESAASNQLQSGYAQVAPLVDSDGDGLTDAVEDANLNRTVDAGESDPTRTDTDGDGVGDKTDLCEGTATGAAVDTNGCACAQKSCNDGNPCTTDSCSGAGACAHAAVANGTSCGDGNPCNGVETCQGGTCKTGTPPDCDDHDACTVDACGSGGCTHTANATCTGACGNGVIDTGETCDDGNRIAGDCCSASCQVEASGCDLTHLGTIIAAVTHPTGTGNPDPEVIRDGDRPPVGTQDAKRQYDTWNGANTAAEDWIGYAYVAPQRFNRVVFQEGKRTNTGGWFETLAVQVRRDGTWAIVPNVTVSPAYPAANGSIGFQTFTLTFPAVSGDAIRLYGKPGGTDDFISVAELEVRGGVAAGVDLTAAGSIVARIPVPGGGGSTNLEVLRDGVTPPAGSTDSKLQYDSFHGLPPLTEDWFGYTYAAPRTFARVVFQEGRHFADGGWFTTLRVQVRQAGAWVVVPGLALTPAYPFVNDTVGFETYGLTFPPVTGDGIRIDGAPGGSSGFTSVGELRVFGIVGTVARTTVSPPSDPGTPDPEPTASGPCASSTTGRGAITGTHLTLHAARRGGWQLTARGHLDADLGPVPTDVTIDLWAADDRSVARLTIPAASFARAGHAWVYRAARGAVAGLRRLRLTTHGSTVAVSLAATLTISDAPPANLTWTLEATGHCARSNALACTDASRVWRCR
ncbi:MAG: fibronectin type III domain-containing protein [Candidatus Binatia bacterium]